MLLQRYPDTHRFAELARSANVIPLCAEILADTETPVSMLNKALGRGQSAFLFESVEGGERWGRFSFLGISHDRHVAVFQRHLEIRENGTRRVLKHPGDPTEALRTYMAQYRPAVVPQLPRFWGGLVGYIAYEAVSFFESIPHRFPESSPLAHFMIPDELLIF